jgi:hypothetical protein
VFSHSSSTVFESHLPKRQHLNIINFVFVFLNDVSPIYPGKSLTCSCINMVARNRIPDFQPISSHFAASYLVSCLEHPVYYKAKICNLFNLGLLLNLVSPKE